MKKLSFFLMAMLFTCATTLQAAEVTETIAMKGFGGLTTSSYENVTKTGTSDLGTEMVAYAFNPKTGQIRGNKTAIAGASITTTDDSKNWSLYNTQAMPGAIKKITVTQTATGNNVFKGSLFVALGTTNQGSVTTVTGAQKNTTGTATEFTFDIEETQGYTYFKLLSNVKFTSNSVAGVVVTVTYVTAEGGEEEVTKYTVTANVNDPAMGAVSGAGEYAEGKTATLTANANAGYRFVNWSNGSTDNPLKITVTENIEITANFEAVPPMTCAEAAATADGTTVVLKPFDVVAVVKDAGYIYIEDESGVNLIYDYNLAKELKAGDHVEGFVGYSSPYNGLPELKPSVAFADLTVTPGTAPEPTLFTEAPVKADVNKYVKFENVTFTANVTYTAGSTGSNSTMVVNGTNVTVRNTFKLAATLSKDKAYNLVGFVAVYNSTIQVYFLSVEEYVAPVVNHTITVSANPAEAGTVTGGGEFEETDEITVKATANEGYEFVNWTENEVEVSTDAEYTFEVLADRALVANFKEAEPEGIEVVLENAYKEVYLVWNRANFFGEHATYGDISVQVNNYNGYGTYAEGVSSRIDGVKVNGSATFENKGETDLLTATLTDAEETVVYIVKAEVPTPKTYEVVATNATYVNLEGWSGAELTVNGLTVGEEELTLTVYWDGVGGSEEGYEASAGFEGSLQGMILVDKGEDDVLSFEGTLKDASDNSYIFDFEATPKAAETYTLTFEEMVIEPGQWDDNLHITAENTEYAIEFQLFGGKTKGYGEYGFTDDYPDVDEIYLNEEYATMLEGTVANYYLNEGLATIELTVVLGIDIYNITLTGQPLVNPEDIVPTDTINITMTKATIGLSQGMPKVAASSEEAELSIVLVGENPYKATVEDFSAASYLVTTAGSLTFLRGGLEIVEVGDVKIAYIGVLCSDHKWYNITLTTGTELPTALENLDTTVAPAKAIVNGQLVIIKNGVQYNAQGAVVK